MIRGGGREEGGELVGGNAWRSSSVVGNSFCGLRLSFSPSGMMLSARHPGGDGSRH